MANIVNITGATMGPITTAIMDMIITMKSMNIGMAIITLHMLWPAWHGGYSTGSAGTGDFSS